MSKQASSRAAQTSTNACHLLYTQQMDNNVRFPVMWASVYTSCSIYVVIRWVTGAAGGRPPPPPHRRRHCGQWRYSLNIFSAFIWFIWLQYSIQPTTTDVDAIYTQNVSNQQETTKAIMTFCSSVHIHIRCNFVRILRFRNNFPEYLLELSTTLTKFYILSAKQTCRS